MSVRKSQFNALSPLLLLLGSLQVLGSITKPVFLVQPQDTVVIGFSFTLMCIASKNTTVTWYHQGHLIDFNWRTDMQKTLDGSLHVSNGIRHRDEGSYRCIASNSRGSIISRQANVRFPFLNPFSVGNWVIGKEETLRIVLQCLAPDSYPEKQIQWSKVDPQSPGTRRPLPQSSKYTVSAKGDLHFAYVRQSDSGDYVCMVTNNNINKHMVRTVVLNVMPVRPLVSQPPKVSTEFSVPKVALKGERFVLECIVYGMPVPNISLRKKGVKSVLGQVTGNARRHYITSFSSVHAGKYKCKATDSSGRTDTVSTIVKMEAKPEWRTKPQDTVAGMNSNTTLSCKAYAVPIVHYQWYYNGRPIIGSSKHTFSGGDLILSGLQYSDGGMYQCVVTNKHGQLLSSAELTVAETPARFGPGSKVPESVKNTLVLSTVVLFCNPTGNPKPVVRWRKGSTFLGKGRRYRFLSNGDLKIINVTKLDSGRYTCEASNRLGSASRSGRLKVQDNIAITNPPDSKRATVGSTVRFSCGVTTAGMTEVTFEWTRFFMGVASSKRITQGKIGEQTGFLDISGVTFADAGLYTCKATAAQGSVQKTTAFSQAHAMLKVQGPPDPPTTVIILPNSHSSHRVNITWKLRKDNQSPITKIIVQQNIQFASSVWAMARIIDDPLQTRTEMVLSPWAEYRFRVVAVNAIGNSTPSVVSMSVSTRPEAPGVYPSDIRSKGKNPNEMQIMWKPLSLLHQNGPGIYYIVYYKRADTKDKMKRNEVRNKTKFTVRGTDYYIRYAFQVQAANDRGFGPKSTIMFGFSGERYPVGKPTDLKVEITSPNSAFATWTAIANTKEIVGGKLLGYKIYFWTDVTDNRPGKAPYQSTIRTSTMMDLDAFTSYRFQVVAYNSRGDGPGSKIVGPIRTPMAIPQPPASLTLSVQNSTYIILSWRPPRKTNGIIIGYTVSVKRLSDGKTVQGTTNQSSELRVHNLNLKTKYQFAVLARNRIGAGPPVIANFDLKIVPKERPTNVRVTYDEFQREALVTWDRIKQTLVDGYKVYIWGEDGIVRRVDVERDRKERTISRLENGNTYKFQVAAFKVVSSDHFVVGPRSDAVEAGKYPVKSRVRSSSSNVHSSRHLGQVCLILAWSISYLLCS